jgi:hypothetical protein
MSRIERGAVGVGSVEGCPFTHRADCPRYGSVSLHSIIRALWMHQLQTWGLQPAWWWGKRSDWRGDDKSASLLPQTT